MFFFLFFFLQDSSTVKPGRRSVSGTPRAAVGKSTRLYWFVLWLLNGHILIQFLISTTHTPTEVQGLSLSLSPPLCVFFRSSKYDQAVSHNSFSSTCLCGVICHYKCDEGNRSSWRAASLLSKPTLCMRHVCVCVCDCYSVNNNIFIVIFCQIFLIYYLLIP